MTKEQKEKLFSEYLSNMFVTYVNKNANYGNSFEKTIDELGLVAGLVPLYNKIHRATALINNTECKYESLDDTLLDLANYALLLRLKLEDKRKEELKKKYEE